MAQQPARRPGDGRQLGRLSNVRENALHLAGLSDEGEVG
jgi:hypothetical protein